MSANKVQSCTACLRVTPHQADAHTQCIRPNQQGLRVMQAMLLEPGLPKRSWATSVSTLSRKVKADSLCSHHQQILSKFSICSTSCCSMADLPFSSLYGQKRLPGLCSTSRCIVDRGTLWVVVLLGKKFACSGNHDFIRKSLICIPLANGSACLCKQSGCNTPQC